MAEIETLSILVSNAFCDLIFLQTAHEIDSIMTCNAKWVYTTMTDLSE